MRYAILFSAIAGTLAAENPAFVSLFDGKTLKGWTAEMKSTWSVQDGNIVPDTAVYGWLRSNESYRDFQLKLEFRTTHDGNSGIFLRSAKEGLPHETGYELQIYDLHPKGFATGSLVNVAVAKKFETQSGKWHAFDITCRGDHFIIKLDGRKVLDTHDGHNREGYIGLQVNPSKPIDFRHIRIRKL